MGERTAYAPGTFSWVDLPTTDVEGATAFYVGLFGWEPNDMPVPGGGVYRMMRLGGRDVCAISAMPEQMRAAGAPPAWLSYVTVDDADAVATRVAELGGSVLGPPFDVMDAGRMALVADPQGAVLALWQPRAAIGAGLVNDPGALTLNQLDTSDPTAAASFYRELFGWEITQVATEPQSYWGIQNGGRLNGGMMALDPAAHAPPHWLVYFTTADIEESAAAIDRLGGAVVMPPTAIESGMILIARDPQGAYFALFEGPVDP